MIEPTPDDVIDRIRRLATTEAVLFAELDTPAGARGTHPAEQAQLDGLAEEVATHLGKELDRGVGTLLARFDDVRDALVAASDGTVAGLRVAVHAFAPRPRADEALDAAVAEVKAVSRWGHGGQVLVTAATQHAVEGSIPRGATLTVAGHWLAAGSLDLQPLFALRHPDLMDGFPPVRSERQPVGELPRYGTDIVGRDDELSSVPVKLGPGRFVTLVGAAGIGKTRLAVELARRADAAAFPDGVRFCDASTITDADDLVELVAAAFGRPSAVAQSWTTRRPPNEPPGDLRRQVMATLKGRLLLVLDDCDRFQPDAKLLVADLLGGKGQATVLATSRTSMRVPGEEVVTVGPLISLGGGQADLPPATELLARLACAAGGAAEGGPASAGDADSADDADDADGVDDLETNGDPGAADAPPVAAAGPDLGDIARRLGAVPLALELTAPLLDTLGPAEVASRLRPLLPTDDSSPDRTVAAAVELAVDALTHNQLRLFTTLSTFAGSWGLEAAQAVAPAAGVDPADVAALLTALTRQALVQVDVAAGGGPARHRMLDAVRAHSASRLVQSGWQVAAAEAHALHFLGLAKAAVPARRTPREPAWVRAIEVEFDNIRVAYHWFVEMGRLDDALEVVWCLADDVLLRLRHEVGHWGEALGSDPGTRDLRLRGAALAVASNTAIVEGRLDRADELAREALQGMDPDAPGRWIALNTAALVAASKDDKETTKQRLMEVAVPGGKAPPDLLAMVAALYQAVLLSWLADDPAEGVGPAAALRNAVRDDWSPSFRAMAALAQGLSPGNDPEQARQQLEQGMKLASLARSPLLYLHGWRGLYLLPLASDDRRDVVSNLLMAADQFRGQENVSEYLQTVVNLAWQARALGDSELAATICGHVSQTPYRYIDLCRLLDEELRTTARTPAVERARAAGAAMTRDELAEHVRAAVAWTASDR